jgi:hypothetical protein
MSAILKTFRQSEPVSNDGHGTITIITKNLPILSAITPGLPMAVADQIPAMCKINKMFVVMFTQFIPVFIVIFLSPKYITVSSMRCSNLITILEDNSGIS